MTVIEVFADVRCPFTHVGLRRFTEARKRAGRGDLHLKVRAWPLELVNGEPLAAALIAEECDALRAQVAPDLFAGFDVTQFPASSLPAMVVAASAYAYDLSAGEAISLALRDALFERGQDISAPAVLDVIASRAAVEPAPTLGHQQVLDDWQEGRQRGVIGSPHFFVAEDDFFCPSLEITRVDGDLHMRFDRPGFEAFLQRCLAA